MRKRIVEMYAIAYLPTEDEIARYVRGEARTRPKPAIAIRYIVEDKDGNQEVFEIQSLKERD